MTEVDLESDAFLMLLTDALRSGPGSPAWHEALQRLRAGGINHGDEYQMLVTAREHLESGKEYRSIRAGPEFAKRLMNTIEQDASQSGGRPQASALVAIASAAVMLAVLLVIGYLLWNAAEYGAGDSTTRLLPNVVTQVEFEQPVPLPSDWQQVGQPQFLDLSMRTMRPIPAFGPARTSAPSGLGGGIYWTTPISPNEPFSISANVRIRHIEENLIAEVFVTDDPQFGAENGTTPHELVWTLEGRHMQVLSPDLRVDTLAPLSPNFTQGFMPLLVTVDHDQTTIDFDNKRVWSGRTGLDPEKSRYAGLRFIRQTNAAGDQVVFQSLRINMRQK